MKIDDESVDLFPTAEAIFREYQDEILWLERRRRNLIITSVFTCLMIGVIVALVMPLIIGIFRSPYQGSGAHHLTAELIYGLGALIAFGFIQYEFIDGFYRKLAKRKCLHILASYLKMTYRRGGYFMMTDVYDHHILPPYAQRDVEEGFAGKFKGFRIEFQDFVINPVRRFLDGSSSPTFRNFYGLALKVQLNKSFKHHTVILPAREQRRFLAQLPNANLFLHEDVNLVYNTFNRHYVCLSTNQIEARYVMDPAVMERFTHLAETFKTDVSASFMDGEMVVMMRPKVNLFEIGSLRAPVTVLTIERTLQQINALRQMAEIFELDDKAGLGARVRDYS